MSQTTCFSCLKTGHINKHCPTRSKAPNFEFKKGKGRIDIEHIRGEMDVEHQMEGSLHLIGQVVTPHQTKQKEGMWN